MSDLPLHRTMQDDEIDRLKARVTELEGQNLALRQQLGEILSAERKFSVNFGEVFILCKQAEAVEAMAAELKGSSRYGKPGFNRGMATAYGFSTGYAHRLRQQADGLEAGKAGGES